MPKKPVEKITVLCGFCGKPMLLLPCHAKDRKYCSRQCRGEGRYRTNAERFWSKVRKGDGCWEWQGYKAKSGYGQVGDREKVISVHRKAWELTYGPIPAGLWVLHHCDFPACCRPDHLFLGTNTDNVHDMVAKGRTKNAATMGLINGTLNKNAKLTDDTVREIRTLYAQGGVTLAQLGARYGVCFGSIGKIVNRKAWAHVK